MTGFCKVGKLSTPEASNSQKVIRRRRTRRHRRNRLIRRALLVVVCGTLAYGLSFLSLEQLSPSLFRASSRSSESDRLSAEASRNLFLAVQQESLRQTENRPVYPYSVVPGGVRDAHELKLAAQRDPVVAAHYAGFDYDHARVVRLVLARTAYVSYRIGNKIYWTRHRISLKPGETVITDGKITARTRCANRIEEIPQQATSQSEPSAANFLEPISPATGTAIANPPVPFQSSLLNRPAMPGFGPAPPLSTYDPLGGGGVTPISPPPLPSVCGIGVGKKGSGTGGGTSGGAGKKKNPGNPCGPEGGTIPEPGSWLLVATGLALMYWQVRQKLGRTLT